MKGAKMTGEAHIQTPAAGPEGEVEKTGRAMVRDLLLAPLEQALSLIHI